jgi:hypothetical protein
MVAARECPRNYFVRMTLAASSMKIGDKHSFHFFAAYRRTSIIAADLQGGSASGKPCGSAD